MVLTSNEWKIAEPSTEWTSVTYSPNPSAVTTLTAKPRKQFNSAPLLPFESSLHLQNLPVCMGCSPPGHLKVSFTLTHLHHYLHLLRVHFSATFPQKHLCNSSVQQALPPVIQLQGWMLERLKVKQEVSNWAGRRTRLLIPNPLLQVLRELPDFLLHS